MKKTKFDIDKIPYNSRLNEAIVYIANEVYNQGSIRKAFLKEITNIKFGNFDQALSFLLSIKSVKEKVLPKNVDSEDPYGTKPQSWLFWNKFQTPTLVLEIQELVKFNEIDLSKYPIRNIELLDDSEKQRLKRFIWKINSVPELYNKKKYEKIAEFLDLKVPTRLNVIYDVLNIKYNDIYSILKQFLKEGRIELGFNKCVLIYRNPKYLKQLPFWFCQCCNHKNSIKNKYCGNCGDKKE